MNSNLTIKENRKIAKDTFLMILESTTPLTLKSGQFINIKIKDTYLRRPISVCDSNDSTLTIIYKVVGKGTKILSQMKKNEELDILLNLGNGYELIGKNPILVGGGVGIPPLYKLAKELISNGISPQVILGFNNKEEIFFKEEFESLKIDVSITTIDGSVGQQGFVTDALLDKTFDYIYACGPEIMLKALYDKTECAGQYSFEERMGCGFGACMGCSCITNYGYKRICKEGPVLKRKEIIWED